MKTKKSLSTIILIPLVLSFLHLSCGTTQRSAVACPEFSKQIYSYKNHHKRSKSNILLAHKPDRRTQKLNRSKQVPLKQVINNDFVASNSIESISNLNKVDYTKGLTASTVNIINPTTNSVQSSFSLMKIKNPEKPFDLIYSDQTKCDTIKLKSGAILTGKVEEIGQSEIKYRKCNNLTGPIISVLRSDVSSILYENGTTDHLGPTDIYIPNQTYLSYNNSQPLKTEGLGLAGFITGFVGLFIASIPLGIIAIIFGIISLSKIRRDPHRFKGRGFAITSFILGIIDVVAMLILLGSV